MNRDLLCIAVLSALGGCGDRAVLSGPYDPGPQREPDLEERITVALANSHAIQSDPDLLERSLGLADRRADAAVRRLDVAVETRRWAESLAREPVADAKGSTELSGLVDAVARRYHLADADYAAVATQLDTWGLAQPALTERLQAARRRHLDALTNIHNHLQVLERAVRSGDEETTREAAQGLEQILDEGRHDEILSTELTYIDSPLEAMAPADDVTTVPAYQAGAAGVIPVVDDTRTAEEVEVTAEIQAQADALSGDPVAIYELVKNDLELVPYFGVMKGAGETFRQRRGGPADLAAVAIALYRAAGIPARYVTGKIRLDRARLANLLGVSGDDAQLMAAMGATGIPHSVVNVAGKVGAVEMEHVWIEIYVRYGHYRGLPLDEARKEWVPLDPGLGGVPRISRAAGALADPLATLGVDAQALYDNYISSVQSELPLETLRAQVEAAAAGQSYEALLDTRSTLAERFGALPSSLPYPVVAVTGEYDFLPDRYLQTVTFSARRGAQMLLNVLVPVHQLAGRRVTISYVGETEVDQSVLAAFGGPLRAPPYLVSVVPVVRADGREIARGGGALGLGRSHDLLLDVRVGGGLARRINNRAIAGNLYALALGAPRNEFTEPEDPSIEDTEPEAGIVLSAAARDYVNRWTAAEEELSALLGVSLIRPVPSEVLVSNNLEVVQVGGVVTEIIWKGVRTDADLRAASIVSTRPGASEAAANELRLLSGLHGSALERQVLTDAFGVEAISADKVLAAAREQGQSILVIDSSNLASALLLVNAPVVVLDDVTDRVSRGQIVTIHVSPVTRADWTGTGYIARNPQSGETAYLLTQGEIVISGGLTIVQPSGWAAETLLALQNYARPAVDIADVPGSAMGVVWLFEPQLRRGFVGSALSLELLAQVMLLDGRPVINARVQFVTQFGTTRCFGTAQEAAAFQALLESLADDPAALDDALAHAHDLDSASTDPTVLEVITGADPSGIAVGHCVAGPRISDGAIIESVTELTTGTVVPAFRGYGEVRASWVRDEVTIAAEVPYQIIAALGDVAAVTLDRDPIELIPNLMLGFPVVARVTDMFSNPLAGILVDWTATDNLSFHDPASEDLSSPLDLWSHQRVTAVKGTNRVGLKGVPTAPAQPYSITASVGDASETAEVTFLTYDFDYNCVFVPVFSTAFRSRGIANTLMPFLIGGTAYETVDAGSVWSKKSGVGAKAVLLETEADGSVVHAPGDEWLGHVLEETAHFSADGDPKIGLYYRTNGRYLDTFSGPSPTGSHGIIRLFETSTPPNTFQHEICWDSVGYRVYMSTPSISAFRVLPGGATEALGAQNTALLTDEVLGFSVSGFVDYDFGLQLRQVPGQGIVSTYGWDTVDVNYLQLEFVRVGALSGSAYYHFPWHSDGRVGQVVANVWTLPGDFGPLQVHEREPSLAPVEASAWVSDLRVVGMEPGIVYVDDMGLTLRDVEIRSQMRLPVPVEFAELRVFSETRFLSFGIAGQESTVVLPQGSYIGGEDEATFASVVAYVTLDGQQTEVESHPVLLRKAHGIELVEMLGVDEEGRVFPGATLSGGDFQDVIEIRVRLAQTPPASGVAIYWDAVDVDDPSTNVAPVDPNGSEGNDNRGDSSSFSWPGNEPDGDDGVFVDTSGNDSEDSDGVAMSVTDANGEAVIRFRVTHQPGDNFEVHASVDRDRLFDGAFEGQTPVFTVWRRLHVEIDRMSLPASTPGAEYNSQVVQIAEVTVEATGVFSSFTYDTPLVLPNDDSSQFHNGLLEVQCIPSEDPQFCEPGTGISHLVVASTQGSLRIQGDQSALNSLVPFDAFLYDDDAVALPVGALPQARAEPLTLPVELAVETGSQLVSAAYAEVFIELTLIAGNPRPIIPFNANIDWPGPIPIPHIGGGEFREVYEGFRDVPGTNAFWSIYMVSAFQPDAELDADPDIEAGTTYGLVFMIKSLLFPPETFGAFIFVETVRERSGRYYDEARSDLVEINLPFTIAHELGHLFDIAHEDALPSTLMSASDAGGTPEASSRRFGQEVHHLIRSGAPIQH